MSNTTETPQREPTRRDLAAFSKLVPGSAVAALVLVFISVWLVAVPGETESAIAVFAAALACGLLSLFAWQENAVARGESLARSGQIDLVLLWRLLVRYNELVAIGSITAVATLLRLWALGDIPNGIHGDEAQVGMDAWRVLREGWIGVYTLSALGQPAGNAYLTAPFLEIFGSTAWTLRLPFALVGAAAVPLAYAVFRMQSNRTVAMIAAVLLATSLWHIHYSRIAHWPISYPTVELLVLLFWTLAIRDGRWHWFLLAGAVLGIGVYTYNIYPIFVIAFTLWVAVYTLVERRGAGFRPWAIKVAGAAAVSFVVAVPLFLYMLDDSKGYFDHYNQYFESYSVLASDAYDRGDARERIDIITSQLERWVGAYAWQGVPDFVDGASANGEPMFDKVTIVLLVMGAGYAAWNWRKTPHLMALLLALVIPLTSVLQTNATYRGALGVVPFISLLAALPLAWIWQHSEQLESNLQLAARLGVAAILAFIGYTSVHTYFGEWDDSAAFRFVYAEEISEASEYMAAAPGSPYVYFFSDRWSFNYETRQYLAPKTQGEDRSTKFGQRQDFDIDRSRDSLFVLLAPYFDKAEEIRRLYPSGREYEGKDGGRTLFMAYYVPADADAPSPGDQPRLVRDPEAEIRKRDEERQQDLALLKEALSTFHLAQGRYPSTNGNIQSACRYRQLDQLCFLESQVGTDAFTDPRGDQEKYGYWYKSDGQTYALFASMESPVDEAHTCPPEGHLQAANVKNVLCIRGP